MTQNDFDEIIHLEEFSKICQEIDLDSYTKVKGVAMPDFIGMKNDGSPLYIEMTQIREADNKVVSLNIAIDRFRMDLQKQLETELANHMVRNLIVTIKQQKMPKNLEKIPEIQNNLCKIVVNNIDRDRVFIYKPSLPQNLQFIDWIEIMHTGDSRTFRKVLVIMDSYYEDPNKLLQRIIDTINTKNDNKYHERIGTTPIWLVITIKDGISNPFDLNQLKLARMDHDFERIYIQSDYWVPTNNYPIFRLY